MIALLAMSVAGCGKNEDPRLANPKSAARTMFQAMYDNDLATAKSCAVTGTGQAELVEGFTQLMTSMRHATDAAYKKFGKEFDALAGGMLDVGRIDTKQIDDGTETITGDSATIVSATGNKTFHLARTGKSWRIDLVKTLGTKVDMSNPKVLRLMMSMFTGMRKAADTTAADIEAGKFTNALSAVQALQANMGSAVEEEKQRVIKTLGN